MKDQTSTYQAQLFLYDLGNSAKEHWFKTDEAWEVSLVTALDKSAIEKKYYPVVSAEYPPELSAEMLRIVKTSLKQERSATEILLDTKTVQLNHLQYLIAYNPKRRRT
jgi:hypothetical protein